MLPGTLRLVEIVWLILHDCDLDTAKSVDIEKRYCFLDMCDSDFKTCYGGMMDPIPFPLKVAKTHLNFDIMRKHVERGKKIVVSLRNPKDTLVSTYHFYSKISMVGPIKMPFAEYFEIFKQDRMLWGDIFDFYIGWWKERHRENILFVGYEELSSNPVQEIKRIGKFLGHELSPQRVETIAKWTSFHNMKKESSLNISAHMGKIFEDIHTYLRKGQVGDWKNMLNEEQSQFIDEKYEERCVPLQMPLNME